MPIKGGIGVKDGRMRARVIGVSIIAAGALALLAPAGSLADGTIRGTVTEDAVGSPAVPNYEVEAYTVGGATPVASTCTLANGTYSLPIPSGTYEVRFAGDGGPPPCGPQSLFAPEWWDNRFSRTLAAPVAVTDAQTTPPSVDAALVDGGRITGKVTAGGSPLGNVTVDVLTVDNTVLLSACSAPATGTYAFDPMPPGIYTVRFTSNGSCGDAGNFAVQYFDGAATQAEADVVAIGVPGEEVHNVDAALVPPAAGGGGAPAGAPETTIDEAKVTKKKGKASFSFSGSGGTAPLRFECELVKKPAPPNFATCTSPTSYKRLKRGGYIFKVRARDASGRVDGTPATANFKSKLKKKR